MPACAPSGDALAYSRARNGDQNNGNALYVMTNGSVVDVTRGLARNINAGRWLPDGKALLLEGFEGTHSVLWQQPLQGSAKPLSLSEIEASADFTVAKNAAVAFIGGTASHPNELYVMESLTAKPHRISHFNDFVDALALGRTTSIEWRGTQGFLEDGVLTYPVQFEAGHQYPFGAGHPWRTHCNLNREVRGFDENYWRQRVSWCSNLHYRGSANLGGAYQHAIFRDTGAGPGNDILAGVSAVLKRGSVDRNRIGVSGWSYGGYLTAWLTGHSRIWKAAVAGAPLTDWVMDYTVADHQAGDMYLFGGSPWNAEHRDI